MIRRSDISAALPHLLRKLIIVLMICGFMPSWLGGQEYFQWRMSPEPMIKDGLPNNHAELHAISSMYLTANLEQSMQWWKADLFTFGLGVAWEVKDGFIPYEKAGYWGGEGFASGDLMADALGIVTHRLAVLVWNKITTGEWNPSRRSENIFDRQTLD